MISFKSILFNLFCTFCLPTIVTRQYVNSCCDASPKKTTLLFLYFTYLSVISALSGIFGKRPNYNSWIVLQQTTEVSSVWLKRFFFSSCHSPSTRQVILFYFLYACFCPTFVWELKVLKTFYHHHHDRREVNWRRNLMMQQSAVNALATGSGCLSTIMHRRAGMYEMLMLQR